MKKLLLFVILLADFPLLAQNSLEDNAINLQKYWNMRHRMLGDKDIPDRYPGMIEIGEGQGKSIPSDNRRPNENNSQCFVKPFADPNCNNQIGCDGDRYDPSGNKKGALFWGDGTIWMGDYIAMLATEWKLLDNCNNPDCISQKAKTEIELYYALQTLNRLDYFGEVVFDIDPSLNGFLARDDVPSYFYENFGKFDALGNYIGDFNLVFSTHSYEELCPSTHGKESSCDGGISISEPFSNTMSQDQAIGIIYGLSFVAKLVHPSVSINGMSLKNEAQAITTRITNYIKNGEPVLNIDPGVNPLGSIAEVMFNFLHGNFYDLWTITDPKHAENVCRGATVLQFSYPIAQAAEIITGNNFHNTISKTVGGHLWGAIHAGLVANQMPIHNSIVNGSTEVLYQFCFPDQATSLCDMGLETACVLASGGFTVLLGLTDLYCNDLVNNTCEDLCSSGILGDFCTPIEACGIWNKTIPFNQFNLNMILKLAAASGTWSQTFLGNNSVVFKKEIYDLAGAVLNDNPPYTNSSFWENNILNSAPCENPCYNPDPGYFCDAGEGWRWNQRWDSYLGAKNGNTWGRRSGNFNGIDYMLAYNLYRLAFPSAGTPYKALIDRTLAQNFPFSSGSNQFGDDTRPLTYRAASTIEYNGVVNPDGNVTLVAGKEIDFGQDFEVKSGGEFDSYYDFMQCEPNYFDDINTLVLKTGNPESSADSYSSISAFQQPMATKSKKYSKNYSAPKKQSDEDNSLAAISIVPNPSTIGQFQLILPDNQFSVSVMNVLGEVVFQQVNAEYRTPLTIDISTQPKGIYFVKFSIGSEMSVQKIVYQ